MKPYLPISPPTVSKPQDWTLDRSFSPAYLQPKLNGVRALLSPDGKLYKKSALKINSLAEQFGAPGHWLDGEIWHPDMDLGTIAGLVNRGCADNETARLQFWAFDLVHPEMKQADRLDALSLLYEITNRRWHFTPTIYCECPLEAKQHFTMFQDNPSYDGMIYRQPGATYQFGKTSAVLKRKRELDGEYLCINVTEGMGKFYGMLGSFQLIMENGVEFSCGGGNLTVADRKAMWKAPPIGRRLQVRYPYLSADGIPQCPQFVRVRDNNDT